MKPSRLAVHLQSYQQPDSLNSTMQVLFEKDERLIFKRFAKICLLSKQISMKTSLRDFSSLFEKSKVEMELSNLFRQCRHCSLCVVLLVWMCTHLFPFCFGSGEGGWDFFHFLMDVVSF